ncbi:hypothetical protein MBM_06760 [Drepanopeziza brunnea f. sp. 'multigermtubi' MB_m1]|uniref:Uncharacterized protein n=1 Tax=Marssonina brunnea f. sp. multigermtubi (strain MB_m1) TaxID=1072389 RepID=K1XQW7_MARBU|nr:uncharacterized protein MBM_06760 [Drepanopeziza brunnea f. sp. 'multigermtubi' MB_m1]EKD14999.1 hypothetical protein MBM_06760 [Drepanopeziza brunnea f. sp. 'multigermtubi' MB_m1]
MSPGPRASVTLAPWDPESPTHVERMYEQCGWKAGPAERCRGLQRQGVIALQWVVRLPIPHLRLHTFLVISSEQVSSGHRVTHRENMLPPTRSRRGSLVDSATRLGREKPVKASKRAFIPIGPISLDRQTACMNRLAIPTRLPGCILSLLSGYPMRCRELAQVSYCTPSSFWSFGSDLQTGRAAMDAAEKTWRRRASASSQRFWLLSTSTRHPGDERVEKFAGREKEEPRVGTCLIYKIVEKMWTGEDTMGKIWYTPGVFMRKEILRQVV